MTSRVKQNSLYTQYLGSFKEQVINDYSINNFYAILRIKFINLKISILAIIKKNNKSQGF